MQFSLNNKKNCNKRPYLLNTSNSRDFICNLNAIFKMILKNFGVNPCRVFVKKAKYRALWYWFYTDTTKYSIFRVWKQWAANWKNYNINWLKWSRHVIVNFDPIIFFFCQIAYNKKKLHDFCSWLIWHIRTCIETDAKMVQ